MKNILQIEEKNAPNIWQNEKNAVSLQNKIETIF